MPRLSPCPWFLTIAALLALAAPARADQRRPPDRRVVDELAPVSVPEPSKLALQYYRSGNWLWAIDEVWGLAVPALFVFTGWSGRLRDLSWKVGRRWFFAVGVYVVLYSALVFVIDLPLSYYQGFLRPHAYGLSRQSLGRWSGNALTSLAVSLIVGVLFAWVPVYLIARSPRRWWLYTSLLMVPFLFGVMLFKPIWIDPLYNRFGPMKDQALEAKILALANRAGIEGGHVFEVNKSVDTKAVNAYVTGFLATKRIVLWDTIIARLDEKELLFVMGHEMGHYVLGHVVRGILLSSLAVFAGLFWVDRAGRWLIERYHLGFDRLSDIAALPLLMLLLNVSMLVLTPPALAYSRHQEHEADRFALEITRTNRSGALAFVKLQQENLGNPRPGTFHKILRSSHPSIGDRVDFCNSYHPWTVGRPLAYGSLFRR